MLNNQMGIDNLIMISIYESLYRWYDRGRRDDSRDLSPGSYKPRVAWLHDMTFCVQILSDCSLSLLNLLMMI